MCSTRKRLAVPWQTKQLPSGVAATVLAKLIVQHIAESETAMRPLAAGEESMAETFKLGLSRPRQRLIEMCQAINYGEIRDLKIVAGEPQFAPPPRVMRDIKLGADSGPRPELRKENFKIKAAVLQLLDVLDEFGDGSIALIEVKAGLPFRVVLQESVAF